MASVRDLRHQLRKERVSTHILFSLIVFCFLHVASPDPGVYTMISDFDIGKPGTANIGTKRGLYSMGKKIKNPEDPMHKLDHFNGMPGPGAYTSKLMTIGHSGPMFNL